MSIGVTSRLVPTAVTVPVLPIPPARESTPASTIISFRRRSAGSIGAPAVHGRENSPLDDGAVPGDVRLRGQHVERLRALIAADAVRVVDAANLTLTVEAGCILQNLQGAAQVFNGRAGVQDADYHVVQTA